MGAGVQPAVSASDGLFIQGKKIRVGKAPSNLPCGEGQGKSTIITSNC